MYLEGRTSITADLIGLAVLAGEVGLLGAMASSLEIPLLAWLAAYAFLAVLAIFTWHGEKWPNKSRKVLKAVLGSFLMGGLFLAVDAIIGHLDHPDLPLIKAAEQTPGPFGFGLTLLACPVMTLFLLAGYFRAVFLEEKTQDA